MSDRTPPRRQGIENLIQMILLLIQRDVWTGNDVRAWTLTEVARELHQPCARISFVCRVAEKAGVLKIIPGGPHDLLCVERA